MVTAGFKILVNLLIAVNIRHIQACPLEDVELKAAYKSGEIHDQDPPITLEKIKTKLKESEIFDWEDPGLTEREKKEMSKLFDTVEIMTTSRTRQPSSVQNMFSSLRLVERVVKKQLKEGQISEALAAKFNWDKLSNRQRREKPSYLLDKTTNMRIFNIH
ncbi:uncharacterized protein LOC110371190 isoform X2 [Helicoverpa armigera]|uniref:uncharacterized protein LOC110371190 isoform X1 n=1 Tax=Helicoverpa armigera TaxID=29058 RepID=UPI000B38E264|nr:uncharacterized protein LOC110371190 isoform X1 [Helicoverpa armigera]XP_047036491.1 uncharacterized protein LOC124642220 isoform X1 [Helicoverpa zea]XP_049706367.1 uncharacterized protein LOC110371190 isoform X2 [Helicoverpa armigera]PZC83236.1 hypothetical protein B5X24_HaOG208327 [Helicoverpa armigera]